MRIFYEYIKYLYVMWIHCIGYTYNVFILSTVFFFYEIPSAIVRNYVNQFYHEFTKIFYSKHNFVYGYYTIDLNFYSIKIKNRASYRSAVWHMRRVYTIIVAVMEMYNLNSMNSVINLCKRRKQF